MKFTKMQGLGNDYVYVNCMEQMRLKLQGVSVTDISGSDQTA